VSFVQVLRDSFPGSLLEADLARALLARLRPLGFTRETTLTCIASCRDEISQTWPATMREIWGDAFNLAGLGGMIFAGKTGFGAALAHAPLRDGRERYLFCVAPHIGIGAAGEPGVCEREGREAPSSACGALLGLSNELQQGTPGPSDDPDDIEQGLIRSRLGERLSAETARDMLHVTEAAHDLILEDIERLLAATVDRSKADYAVLSAIQVHGPGMKNYLQPRTFYAIVGGERKELKLPREVEA
jgi:hypothetical protein